MISLKAFLVLFFAASYLTSSTLAVGKGKGHRQYNEQCVRYDASASCDAAQGLMCLDSGLKGYRCSCPTNKLHSQLFDTKRNACVGKVLNACVRGGSQNGRNDSLCVDNAECNTAVYGLAVCLCKTGFTETDDGLCTPSLKHGDNCETDEVEAEMESPRKDVRESKDLSSSPGLCDEKHGQKCIAGKCQCRFPSEQYYDQNEGKCISYASGRCSHQGQVYSCVPNANCPAPPFRIGGAIGPLGLPALPPFLSAFATAAAGEGDEIFVMPLRPPRLPHPPLPPPIRHPLHQIPHPQHQRHHVVNDEPVTEFDSRFDNYDYARSIFFGAHNQKKRGEGDENADSSDTNHPRCQCRPGYTRTAAGYCMKGYGNKCSPEDDSGDIGNGNTTNTRQGELCNADQFLECMDAHDGSFTCQCRNQMNERYDPERKECVAMVGRRCRPLGNYPKCEQGSQCVDGICQCASGTSMTPMETCARDYDEKCKPGQCNVWKGLMCHGKSRTCLCVDSYLRYDKRKGACVASRGSMCGSMRSTPTSWGNAEPEMAYVDCEDGMQCKERTIGGKKMSSMCV